MLAGNAIRIAALILIGAAGYETLALETFHSRAGFLVFVPICLAGIAALEGLATHSSQEAQRDHAAQRYIVPLLVVTGVGLTTSAFFVGPDRAYFVRTLGGALAVLMCSSLRGLRLRFDPGAIGVGTVGFVLWWGLAGRPSDDALQQWYVAWDQWSVVEQGVWVVLRVVGTVVVIPLVEELGFRGFLLRRLAKREFEAVAYSDVGLRALVLSSVAFGLAHPDVWAGIVTGLLFGWAAMRRGRLEDAIVAHAITNGLLAGAWLMGLAPWALV